MALPVLTIAETRDWEKASWAAGQTEAEVIRRVGQAVARQALGLTRPDDLILILAGKGNNGADARGAGGHLAQRRVELLEVTSPAADLAKLDGLLALRPALVIDGLFGIGLNRPLDAEWIRLIERVNAAASQVLAVDVPSGLNADTGVALGAAIRASVTLTVGAPKLGLLAETAWPYVGRLEIASDVGLVAPPPAAELQWTMPEDFSDFPPRRAAAAHKGSFGHLGILAGSLGFHGAAVLAARGAQRAQPGLITLHTFKSTYHVIASQMQAVMVSPWQPATKMPGPWTAILLGPGLAAAKPVEEVRVLTRSVWRDSALPVIVDASGLDWLPVGPVMTRSVLRVITPHAGEAARLLGGTAQQIQSNRLHALRVLSKRFGDCWVVLKGHQTLVGRSTGEVFYNSSGNPHLAQGGSGDALSGYIAGLLTQPALRADPFKALRFAVWQHGAAADRLQATRPDSWTVEDLVQELGKR